MNGSPENKNGNKGKQVAKKSAFARLILPAAVLLLSGAATYGWMRFHHRASPAEALPQASSLSDATKTVLHSLDAPVEVRFYSILDPATVSRTVQAYSDRVDRLISQYEAEAGGKLKIVRANAPTDAQAQAAAADGIRAFNMDKGDSCYFGFAILCGNQKQLIPNLDPAWEMALEADLTRAINLAAQGNVNSQPVARASAATIAAVNQNIPDVAHVSVQDGTETLRSLALAQSMKVVQDAQEKIKAAEAQFANAQANGTEAEQQAARDTMIKTRDEASAMIRQIALDTHAQIVALQQMKQSTP